MNLFIIQGVLSIFGQKVFENRKLLSKKSAHMYDLKCQLFKKSGFRAWKIQIMKIKKNAFCLKLEIYLPFAMYK